MRQYNVTSLPKWAQKLIGNQVEAIMALNRKIYGISVNCDHYIKGSERCDVSGELCREKARSESCDWKVGPLIWDNVHYIDDILRHSCDTEPGRWWEVRLMVKIDDKGDLILDYIDMRTPRIVIEENNED